MKSDTAEAVWQCNQCDLSNYQSGHNVIYNDKMFLCTLSESFWQLSIIFTVFLIGLAFFK